MFEFTSFFLNIKDPSVIIFPLIDACLKPSKSKSVQLVTKTETSLVWQITNLTTEVKDQLGYFKKMEADLAVTKNINTKFMERVVLGKCSVFTSRHY